MLTPRAEHNAEKSMESHLRFCKLLLFVPCFYSAFQNSKHTHPGVNDGIPKVLEM